MKIADDAFVVHVIDDRLMRVDLVGDRIDEELDEVVVAPAVWVFVCYYCAS